jgi:hypothetical protein
MRNVLDEEIINLIRWPSLSKEEFALVVSCKQNRLLNGKNLMLKVLKY